MPRSVETLEEYLRELRETKKNKPPQVKEALNVYIELWESAIKNKVVSLEDRMSEALAKVEAGGGLYQVAESGGVDA